MTLLRNHLGSALRAARLEQGRSLREVAKSAKVSLGYLSEVERGQKEASSEMIKAICEALNLTLLSIIQIVLLELEAAPAPAQIAILNTDSSALQIEEAA
jgi:transcriptional regulator with XRE-family HTH domain